MKRMTSRGLALTVLAMLAISGPAAAFTPVPIPAPRAGTVAIAHVAHDRARAISRLTK